MHNGLTHEQIFIIQITVAVCVALCGGLLAFRLKQSPIVGYLVGGICIGPFTPGFVLGDREEIAQLAEIGVLFLMFALGIEFSIKELNRVRNAAIFGTSLQMLFLISIGYGLGHLLGWPWTQSLFFGGTIAVSSTMVIIKTLMDRGEIEAPHGRLLLGMLIVQDLFVVLLMLLLPKIAQQSAESEIILRDLLWVSFKAVAFIATILYLGSRVVPRLMASVEALRSPELFILTAVALALSSASVAIWMGLSPALGAFMAGLLLTESDFDHRVVSELIPVRDLFAALFFISIGMLIDLKFVLQNAPQVLGLGIFLVVAKLIATGAALLPFRVGTKTWAFATLGMIPIGEFNFVLAQVGRSSGAISVELYNLILTSSLFAIMLTPSAFYIAPRVSQMIGKWLGKKLSPHIEMPEVPEALHGHAVVIGYGRVGRRMTRGLRQSGLEVVVVDQELSNVRELLAQDRRALYGDASQETVLALTRPQTARVIVVALPDFGATRAVVHRAHKMNPDVIIIARAQRATDDARLREAGATAVIVPEIAGALMMLEETLLHIGIAPDMVYTGFTPVLPPNENEAKPAAAITTP